MWFSMWHEVVQLQFGSVISRSNQNHTQKTVRKILRIVLRGTPTFSSEVFCSYFGLCTDSFIAEDTIRFIFYHVVATTIAKIIEKIEYLPHVIGKSRSLIASSANRRHEGLVMEWQEPAYLWGAYFAYEGIKAVMQWLDRIRLIPFKNRSC